MPLETCLDVRGGLGFRVWGFRGRDLGFRGRQGGIRLVHVVEVGGSNPEACFRGMPQGSIPEACLEEACLEEAFLGETMPQVPRGKLQRHAPRNLR